MRRLRLPCAAVAVAASLAAGSTGCRGLGSSIEYPDDSIDVDPLVATPEGDSDPSISLGELKIRPDACKGLDVHPITQPLNQDDFTRFLEVQGIKITPKKARTNLYWYDFPNGESGPNGFVRLRLAILDSPGLAAEDLHGSLLEHGPGWWGVRRSNLALLAPKAGLREALRFALARKLACWGVFTYAGLDDAYVVPGPYAEP